MVEWAKKPSGPSQQDEKEVKAHKYQAILNSESWAQGLAL